MFPLKRLSGFFACCAVLYALLVYFPWRGPMNGYRACFRAAGNVLFHSFGSAGSVSFKPLSSGDHTKDTTVVLMKRRPPPARGEMDIKSAYLGYRPTAFLIAMVAATPIPWSRRWRALLWGLVWVSLFVACRVAIQILDAFSDDNALALYSFGPLGKGLVKVLLRVVVLDPTMDYLAPTFVWLLVAFRRDDWGRMFGSPRAAGSRPRVPRRRPS